MRILFALLFMFFTLPGRAAGSCDAGYFLNDAGECEICPAGYYCENGFQYLCYHGDSEQMTVISGAGLTDRTGCEYQLSSGYYVWCQEGLYQSVDVRECRAGEFCPGITYKWGELTCSSWGNENGYEICPDGTYSDAGAAECTTCPPDNNTYADSCDISYGELECEVSRNGTAGIEGCAIGVILRYFETDGGAIIVNTYLNDTGDIQEIRAYGMCAEEYELSSPDGEFMVGAGILFDTVSDAISGTCVFSGVSSDIPDGTVCIDLGIGTPMCVTCAELFGVPMMLYSDGARTAITHCYALSSPGYKITYDPDTYQVFEVECPAGDYCPGGIKVRYNYLTDSIEGGNKSCSGLGSEYTLSAVGASSPEMCYAQCGGPTSPDIENGEFVYSEPYAYYPNVCSGQLVCDDGYSGVDNACYHVCGSGVTKLRTSGGLSFTLFAERVTTHALHISHNDKVCYAPLFSGQSAGAININVDGKIYHIE